MIGSSFEARRAGHTPNTTPTTAENAKAITTDCELMEVFQANRRLLSIAPPLPMPTPIAPPTRHSTTASMRN